MLYVPHQGRRFNLLEHSYGTTRPGTNFGTAITPSVGSKSAWTQIGSFTLSAPAYGLLINFNSHNTAGATNTTVCDIGIDPAGGTNFSVLIPDLFAAGAQTYTATGGGRWYYFPLYLPAGCSLGARAQSNNANALRVFVTTFSYPSALEALRYGSFVESLGITGVNGVTNTGGGTTNEGSWNLIGTINKRCWWWNFALQVASSDTTQGSLGIHIDLAVGDSTNKDLIAENVILHTTTSEQNNQYAPCLAFNSEFDCPAGSSIYGRLQSSGTLDTFEWAVWGCGG